MKHILCKTCGGLYKPGERSIHEKECRGKKHSSTCASEECNQIPVKRQKTAQNDYRSPVDECSSRCRISTTTSKNPDVHSHDGYVSSAADFNDDVKNHCCQCGKQFSKPFNRDRHEKRCNGPKVRKTSITACGKCRKKFNNYMYRLQHEKRCKNENDKSVFKCNVCNESFISPGELVKHEAISKHNSAGGSGTKSNKSSDNSVSSNKDKGCNEKRNQNDGEVQSTQPKCRHCGERFICYKQLYDHRMLVHKQRENNVDLQNDPWFVANETPPWENADGSVNERMRRVYAQHRHLILGERVREGDVRSTYNFPVMSLNTVDQLMEQINFIYRNYRSQTAFKVNLSFGLLLQHVETEQYRYFAPHYTDGVFLFPQLVNNRNDIVQLRQQLSHLDIPNYIRKQRPDTKWRPVLITNVLYTIHKTNFPLGLSQPLPKFIVQSRSIISFHKDPNNSQLYTDELCFFRCLAYHETKNRKCETITAKHHNAWLRYCRENKFKSTDVNLSSMPDLEQCFRTNVNVYELNEDKTVKILYKSRECISSDTNKTMNLNLYEDHLSYISKLASYASKFKCKLCDKLFDRKNNLVRHELTCQNATTLRFPGGYFIPSKTVFQQLNGLGISVDQSLQSYPWFITFDMESMSKTESEAITDHLTKTQLHQPVSVSISSNVECLETPEFILESEPENLLNKMLVYMNKISDKAYSLAKERWRYVFSQINALECKWNKKGEINIETSDDDDADADNDDDDDVDLGGEAMETNECEPPSEEFIKAISKENVFYKFLQKLDKTGNFEVEYNDWDDTTSNCSSCGSSSSSSSSCSSSSSSSSSSNSSSSSSSRSSGFNSEPETEPCATDTVADAAACIDISSDDDDDDNDDDILPFQPLNPRRINDDDDNDEEEEEEKEEDYRSFPETSNVMLKLIRRTRQRFETYCQQIPVLGFNSAKYDLNLVKTKLAKLMRLHEPKQQKFVVKKNSSYMCLSNSKLRFLDMINYLPPGTSYDTFLQTFGVEHRKSYFPYEYFTDVSVLDETGLPQKEAFFSSLKQCNVLEDQTRITFEKLIQVDNKTEAEALAHLKLESPPLSKIDEKYDYLLEIWRSNEMKTFKDFLKYYNNLDSLPMVEGVEKYRLHFEDKGIDIFKDCISVPGAARLDLYRSGIANGANCSLIDKMDEDLYHTLKSNIIGGPSIIFSRYQEANNTLIRSNVNFPCRSVVGYDANALYLKCICEPMPCGSYIRRKSVYGFKPERTTNRYQIMFDWLEWLNYSQPLDIKHKMNNGEETRIGPYLADGYGASTNTVYEFLGCYFHGHDCVVCSDVQKQNERRYRTDERIAYVKQQGYNVVYIWECEFKRQLKENKQMRDFVDKRYPEFYNNHKGRVKSSDILQAIIDDTLFGFIEVDIQVPKSWDDVDYKPETILSPQEYFEEMCPLFCTTDVPYEAIGEHMQNHVEMYNLSKKPRNLLVGGTKAECLLLASPLLKWYLEHGLEVTKIYQVVEFRKKACFKDFGDSITRDRRLGDVDKSQELRSALSKLIGNSAFGGTIINKEKFQSVKYVEGFKKACFAVNNPRFRQINELGDSIFETEFAKANISINSPIYLGYTIRQYAKLHMLSFYYDFLDQYLSRDAFEMVEMDTDSCYFALSSESLRDAVKPEKLEPFLSSIHGYCSDDFLGDNFQSVWFPRECCETHAKFDSRTPGLMKLEFKGTQFIGLCSKSYVGINKTFSGVSTVKYSLKGVNKQFFNPVDTFENVIQTGKPSIAVNRGIRTFGNSVFTYVQPKQAFNYFYCKRIVQFDGIHTKPLDIVLKPKNKYKEEQELWLADIYSSFV